MSRYLRAAATVAAYALASTAAVLAVAVTAAAANERRRGGPTRGAGSRPLRAAGAELAAVTELATGYGAGTREPACSPSADVTAPPARAGRTLLRELATAGRWTLAGILTALAVGIAGLTVSGGRALSVMSGSMEPTIQAGDLVFATKIAPGDARVGDVVTFADPSAPRLLTHRVRSVAVAGDEVRFVTKGDRNNSGERWSVPRDGRIGKVEYRLPKAGYFATWARGRAGRLLLVVVPVLLLGAAELRRIWSPKRRERLDALAQ